MCNDPSHNKLVEEIHDLNKKTDELTEVLEQMADYVLLLEDTLASMRREQAELTALFDPPFDKDNK